jgi:hypothetical protein
VIRLSKKISSGYAQATKLKQLFDADEDAVLRPFEAREQPNYGKPGDSCKYNLFFGFFFDGTRNNYMACEPSDAQAAAQKAKEDKAKMKTPNCHSNVARLYDTYPGQSVPGVLSADADWAYKPDQFKHFYKVYIPGVGTEFKQVGDSGEGFLDRTLGAAAANNSSARMVWALVQAINNVHRFFKQGEMLVKADEAERLANRLHLSAETMRRLREGCGSPQLGARGAQDPLSATREAFAQLLKRLHEAVRPHWPTGPDLKPARLDPGLVQVINVSVFGFSRGAAKARVFVNWLQALGALDAELSGRANEHAMTLGGFPLKFDFLGVFDTVASVGLANSLGDSIAGRYLDGHAAWADAEVSLRVPSDVPCLHLVAAHEVRRSFPLDSISVKGQYGPNLHEVVFPGVHSDVGGGYAPCEQGKGQSQDGQDMLSRLPLISMYREARLSGVPLKLELASDKAKLRFALSPKSIEVFNAYLAVCQLGKPGEGNDAAQPAATLTQIFREQRKLYIQWRQLRRVGQALPLHETDSFKRASVFDRNDLDSANREFESEIQSFETWLKDRGQAFKPERQLPGFDRDHEREWQEIATWWRASETLPAQAATFFDEYLHDSRAWFKLVPGNPDSEDEMVAKLKGWVQRIEWAQARRNMAHRGGVSMASDGLTTEERQAALEFKRTEKIPRMRTEGREPFFLAKAGYLRFRKVYAGADDMLISGNNLTGPAAVAQSTKTDVPTAA